MFFELECFFSSFAIFLGICNALVYFIITFCNGLLEASNFYSYLVSMNFILHIVIGVDGDGVFIFHSYF